MVNCSFCGIEIKRLVFCNPSHKVMFHRKGIKVIIKKSEQVKTVLDLPNLCEHKAAPSFCKKNGCKNYATWR